MYRRRAAGLYNLVYDYAYGHSATIFRGWGRGEMLYSSPGWAHCSMGLPASISLMCLYVSAVGCGMRHSLADGVGASNPPTPVDVPAGRPAAYMLYTRH